METFTPNSLAFKLSSPAVQNDVATTRYFISRVMMLSTQRLVDMTPLVGPMVNLVAHSDLLIKKMACNFVCKYSDCQSELMLLAVNTLLKDCKESNPMVRGLALRTITSGNHPAFQENQSSCIMTGLADQSAYVRRTAVMSCLKINQEQREALIENGMVDKLYKMIRDQDPIVLVNCLLVLEELLKSEGGVVVNKNMVKYLISRLGELTAWGLQYVLKILRKYTPKSEEELFDFMNILDPYLQHNNITVCVHALELFLSLIKDLPHLQGEAFQRSTNSFLGVFSSGNVELMNVMIFFLEKFVNKFLQKDNHHTHKAFFGEHHRTFFCRQKDPDYLKERKLRLLIQLITEDNIGEIFEEVWTNCSDKSQSVSLCAIQALAEMAEKFPSISTSLIKAFKKLLSSDSDHILSNTLQVLANTTLTSLDNTDELALQLCDIKKKIHDSSGKTAILILIGQIGCDLSETSYLMEQFVEEYADLDIEVKGQLLMTCVKVFCKRPAECQNILGELLDRCLDDKDRSLKDQAKFYYALLESDISRLNQMMNNL